MAATFDVLSNGRLKFCIGAGWYEPEYRAYSIDYADLVTRISQLKESVQIIKKMWTEEHSSFEGKYYHIHHAICNPKLVQKPHPPIWIGGKGEKLILRAVAEFAQRSNFVVCTPQECKDKVRVLSRYCASLGRNLNEIKFSLGAGLLVDQSEQRLKRQIRKCLAAEVSKKGRPVSLEEYKEPRIIGSPEECIEKIHMYTRLKIDYFILWFLGQTSLKALNLFADQFMQEFKLE